MDHHNSPEALLDRLDGLLAATEVPASPSYAEDLNDSEYTVQHEQFRQVKVFIGATQKRCRIMLEVSVEHVVYRLKCLSMSFNTRTLNYTNCKLLSYSVEIQRTGSPLHAYKFICNGSLRTVTEIYG